MAKSKRKSTTTTKTFVVTFVGDYYTLSSVIVATDDKHLEAQALNTIREQYGWNLENTYTQTLIQDLGENNNVADAEL